MDQVIWYGLKGAKNLMGTGANLIATVVGTPFHLVDHLTSKMVKRGPAEVTITVPDHIY